MVRSQKQWCEHCQQYISQKRAIEHRAFLFDPYPTTGLTQIFNDLDTSGPTSDNPPLDKDSQFPEASSNTCHSLPQGQNVRAWVEDAEDDEDLMDGDDWMLNELEEHAEEDPEEDFDWDAFVRRYRVANGNLSAEELFGALYEQEASDGGYSMAFDMYKCSDTLQSYSRGI
jgi:hypothetical protein